MKKKLLFIMLALFSMMGSANAQGIEGNFSVSPDPVIIEAGGTAKVTLNLTNYSAFTGYEAVTNSGYCPVTGIMASEAGGVWVQGGGVRG